MNKRKFYLLSVTVTSMIAVTGAVLVINDGLNSSSIFATNGEVWHHYAAVAPTKTTHGSKEFWASSADGCATHTFTDPGVECIEHDFSTYDSFASLSRDDDRYVWCLNEQPGLGIVPVFDHDDYGEETISYGLYPQTNINDSALISALNALTKPDTNGYYFYENAYYAKLSATPYYGSNYNFDNDTAIVSGNIYWFKCEPITWTILTDDYDGDGMHIDFYLLSNVLLDAHRYDDNSNNYENSEIRSFLNKDFYNLAFALGDSYIQTTTVDNSASTTNSSPNPYACNNTQDKVFLPSYQDYINSSYGFETSSSYYTETRYCKPTDWARARGANCYNEIGSFHYNGCYWTRSPYYNGYYDTSDTAWLVDVLGNLNYNPVESTYASVRPAIKIKNA